MQQRSMTRSEIFGIAATVGAFFVAKYYSLWVLVPLPSSSRSCTTC